MDWFAQVCFSIHKYAKYNGLLFNAYIEGI